MLTPEDLRHPQDVQVLLRSIARLPPGTDALRREDSLVVLDALLAHIGPAAAACFAQPGQRGLSFCAG